MYEKGFDGIVNEIIRKNLKMLREKHNLSITYVSSVINKSRQCYSYYESGEREISIATLYMLALFYSVSLESLISNPELVKTEGEITFNAYEATDDGIKKMPPLSISNEYGDMIIVKIGNNIFELFETTNQHVTGLKMLFEYKGRNIIVEVYKNTDESLSFLDKKKIVIVSKKDKSDLIFIGVHHSILKTNYEKDKFL